MSILDLIKNAPTGVFDLGYHPRDDDNYRWEAEAPDGSSCAFASFRELDRADEVLVECQARSMEGRPPDAQPYTRWALVKTHFTTHLSIVREV